MLMDHAPAPPRARGRETPLHHIIIVSARPLGEDARLAHRCKSNTTIFTTNSPNSLTSIHALKTAPSLFKLFDEYHHLTKESSA